MAYSQNAVPRTLVRSARSISIGCSVTTRSSQLIPTSTLAIRSGISQNRSSSSTRSHLAPAFDIWWSSHTIGAGTSPSGHSNRPHRRLVNTSASQPIWDTCRRIDHHIHSFSGLRSSKSSCSSVSPATSVCIQSISRRYGGMTATDSSSGISTMFWSTCAMLSSPRPVSSSRLVVVNRC